MLFLIHNLALPYCECSFTFYTLILLVESKKTVKLNHCNLLYWIKSLSWIFSEAYKWIFLFKSSNQSFQQWKYFASTVMYHLKVVLYSKISLIIYTFEFVSFDFFYKAHIPNKTKTFKSSALNMCVSSIISYL